MLTAFNCLTQSQYCPLREDFDVSVGPFVVWPVGIKRDREIKENGWYDKRCIVIPKTVYYEKAPP